MTDLSTQSDAYAHVMSKGRAEQVRRKVVSSFLKNGPMADYELFPTIPEHDIRCLLARRKELNQAFRVGLMKGKRLNPDTKRQVCVWGLITEHGADPYRPPDRIEIRYLDRRVHVSLASGQLNAMTVRDVAENVVTLMNKLKAKAHP